MKKILAFSKKHGTMIKHGALAQLGARHTGSVEATGSSPVCSTFDFKRIYSGKARKTA